MYKKPQIKAVHGVLVLESVIRIGSGLDYAIEIDNPNQKYTKFIHSLSGIDTVEEIIKNNPSLNSDEILEALETLDSYGYLEDAEDDRNNLFSDDELNKYKVNLNFFSTLKSSNKYEIQNKLKNSRILILGLGGIGSNICISLCELGIGNITAVDFDTVDSSNLNRQLLYDEVHIGRLKTEAAAERVHQFNSSVNFKAISQEISSFEDVKRIVKKEKYDAVVNVADYPTGYIDSWVNRVCVEYKIPLFAASVSKKWGRVYSVIPHETACYQCQCLEEERKNPNYLKELEAIKKTSGAETSRYRTPNGALGPACLFQGYFVGYEILRLILFGSKALTTNNKRFNIDFMSFSQNFDELIKFDDCPVCGGKNNG
ncbi:HesA/MoeB/ThiF family protein [Lactococcus allomyrinae]|uniref:ThiF family adenylyltransferase n=1 Tax=Lactococcus allomyrinae TaxID=2419773 RepID=A0A387BG11_9LACT|nr:ThiF family adenylyltransferase [Lactococcus allomyrinae]AYG01072.1 ThiF family adenylyltransferase [Lactococcus allomyrinae]